MINDADATVQGDGTYECLILDNAPFACNFWDANGQIIGCNPASLRMFGLSSKQELLSRIDEILPEFQPDGRYSKELMQEYIQKALQTGSATLPVPWMRRHIAGELIPSETTVVRVMKDGEPILAFFIRDLRKETELQAEKHEADERIRAMFDATPLGCTLWDEESKLIDCNQEAVRLFGLSSKQELLERFLELSPKWQANGRLSAELIPMVLQAHHKGYFSFEWLHQKVDGELIPSTIMLVRVKHRQGYAVAAYIRDLRAERKLQAEKQEADERMQIMFDATPLGCTFWDEESRLVDCNTEALRLFEVSDKQEFLKHFHKLSPEYQPDGLLSAEWIPQSILQAHRDNYMRLTWMHQTLSGEPLPVEVTLVRVQRARGYIVVAYIRDLREEVKRHALQQEKTRRATMLAGISHDIRAPLTKLQLAMDMAIPEGCNDTFVHAAERYIAQIESILQQFTDYAGSRDRELPEVGNLNTFIEELAGNFASQGHEFELSPGALPEMAFRPIGMMRLLMNLMQNAVNYGKTGLAIRTWTDASDICIAVSDRGTSLTAQELNNLKAPFQRGRNTKDQTGGTGLGLAIAESMVKLHGGQLQFHDRDGGGLEARVVLPIVM